MNSLQCTFSLDPPTKLQALMEKKQDFIQKTFNNGPTYFVHVKEMGRQRIIYWKNNVCLSTKYFSYTGLKLHAKNIMSIYLKMCDSVNPVIFN